MKLSRYLLATLKTAPADADAVSTKLMFRAGMIRKVASGIYDWLPLGLRSLKRVEEIVRQEMDSIGGQEVWLPLIQPREIWEETGRWKIYGETLLRIKDRKGAEFCFAPTAEEIITDLVRREVRSWRQIPLMLYQFATKFRDEIRPRFGVMRAREFYMKDAYSFHPDEEDAERYYWEVVKAYERIFSRCGLKFKTVEAETGPIGGAFSHEFMVLAETGEDQTALCAKCGYAANVDRAECHPMVPRPESARGEQTKPLEEVPTPGKFTVDDVSELLNLPKDKFIKTLFFEVDGKPVLALVRGDHELNEFKLMHVLECDALKKASEDVYRRVADCAVGYAGPVGLKKPGSNLRIVADHALKSVVNGVSGANKEDFHLININLGRDYEPDRFADLRLASAGDLCGKCGGPFGITRGIEVGHTFKLGTKYSNSLKATYLDRHQKAVPFVMGCYGIGVSRIVAAAIEQSHDGDGIIWPLSIAPFKAIVLPTDMNDEAVLREAGALYEELQQKNVPVLLDDRQERAGVKFKDADLIGIPFRLTVSPRTVKKSCFELKRRNEPQAHFLSKADCIAQILQ